MAHKTSFPSLYALLVVISISATGYADPSWSEQDIISDINRKNNILEGENGLPWPLFYTAEQQENLRSARNLSKRGGRLRQRGGPDDSIYIKDCVKVVASPGTYVVRPGIGNDRACGVYMAGLHNERIRVDISLVDVSCENSGLVAFFDGWEMNGHIFPAEHDHKYFISERVVKVCKETFPVNQILRLRSSQNVALIQYRIPTDGEGFIFRVTMEPNHDPCNVLVTEEKRLFTLTNAGRARNCSLSAVLSPPNLKLIQFQIGQPRPDIGLISPCTDGDYVDIGGASNLDPSQMEVKESICGREPTPAKMGLTVLCDSSSVRLVSSGYYDNSVTVLVKEATDADVDYRKNIIMMCPGFT